MRKAFEIQYRDPHTDLIETVVKTFDDSEEVPAALLSDDCGYMLADKGWYRIKEVKDCPAVVEAEVRGGRP